MNGRFDRHVLSQMEEVCFILPNKPVHHPLLVRVPGTIAATEHLRVSVMIGCEMGKSDRRTPAGGWGKV